MTSLSFDIFARDHASRQIRDVGDEFDKLNRKIDEVNAKSALTRSESDSLDRGFSKLSVSVGGLGREFTRLSGSLGRVGGLLHGVGAEVVNLGAAAGKMAASLVAGAAQFSLLASSAASAALSVGQFAAALAPAVGALAAVPGGLALAAAGFGTLKLALTGVGKAFSEAITAATVTGDVKPFLDSLKGMAAAVGDVAIEIFQIAPLIKGLQTDAQQGLFGPLVGHIADLIPVLSTLSGGIKIVADQFGQAAVQLLNFARSAESLAAISSIFASTRDLLRDLRPALEPVLAGFRDLAVVGAAFTAGLGPGIAAAATRFGEFLSAAASSGRALDWMNGALEVFKQLGGVAKDVAGILSSVFDALRSSGGGALGIVGQLLDKLNAFLASSRGQAILVEIFTALHQVGVALAPILGALAGALATLAPQVAAIATAFAPLVTEIINALAPALAALGPGIVAVGNALARAFGQPAIAAALLDFGRGVSELLTAIRPLFSALLNGITLIAPKIIDIGKAFAPLATTIVNALAPALAALAPGIIAVGTALSQAFARPEVAAALLSLGQGISNLLIALTPLIGPLVQVAAIIVERFANGLNLLATFLTPVVSALADVLAPILPQIATLMGQVSDAIKPLVAQFGTELAGALKDTQTFLAPLMDALREVGSEILSHLQEVLPQITPSLGELARAFADVAKEIFKLLPDFVRFAGDLLVQLIDQLPVLVPMLKDLALAFLDMFKQLTPLIPDLLKLLTEFIKPIIPELPKLLPPLIDLVRIFDDLFQKLSPLLKKFLESPEALAAVKFLSANAILALNALRDGLNFVIGAVQVFLGTFFGLPDQVTAGLGRMAGAIKGWLNDIIGWVERIINGIADAVPGGIIPHVSIPRLARGAIVDRPTLGVFGEAGPEVVVPLSNPRRARQLADASGLTGMLIPPVGAGGGTTVVYNVSVSFAGYPLIGETEIARVFIDAVNAASKQGFPLGVLGSS